MASIVTMLSFSPSLSMWRQKLALKGTSMQVSTQFPGLWWFLGLPWLVLMDQISKIWIIKNISYGQIVDIIPSLNFTHAHNYGIAFSLLNNKMQIVQIALIAFAILICGGLGIWLSKVPLKDKWLGIALVFILGGAIGNLIDRIRFGYVIDFIDCYWRTWHFYTFNLADSFITIGALMIIKTIIFSPPDQL